MRTPFIFTMLILSSCSNEDPADDDVITISVGKHSGIDAYSVIQFGVSLIDQAGPNKIEIRSPESGKSIRLSSSDFSKKGPLQNLHEPTSSIYDGQIALVKQFRTELLFSGHDRNVIWYVVEEGVKIPDLIAIVSERKDATFMVCDSENFSKSIEHLTVKLDKPYENPEKINGKDD